jgi:hypothetical protein
MNTALWRFLNPNSEIVNESVLGAVKLRQPQYPLEIVAVGEQWAGSEQCVIDLALLCTFLRKVKSGLIHTRAQA